MFSTKKIDVDNLSISYIDNELQTKNVLLFVHGWGADKYNLQGIFNNLSEDYRIISLDLPGFGQSSLPEKTYGSNEYALIISKFINLLNLKKVIYIGHSFGGKIGIVLSAHYGDCIEKLILINSSGLRAKRNIIWYIKVYFFKFMKIFYSRVLNDEKKLNELKNKFGSDDYKNAGKMRDILVKTVAEDFSEYLPEIKCPVFIYWGDKDKSTPIWMAKKMKKLIKDSGLYVVKGGSHFSFVDDNRIISIIKSFVGN